MKFLNPHLKNYVFKNTPKKVRDRAMDSAIFEAVFEEENHTAEFKVLGSEMYMVKITNYDSDQIQGTCTCPYDYGAVCKHMVSAIAEIDKHLGEPVVAESKLKPLKVLKNKLKQPETNNLYQFNAKTKTYTFTKTLIKNLDEPTFLKITSRNVYNQYSRVIVDKNNYNAKDHKISLHLKSDYWTYIPAKILVSFYENSVDLQTDCQCHKNRVCKHVAKALEIIKHDYSHLLLVAEELNKVKENLLQEYGFTLQDKAYQKYFDFESTPYGIELKHKVKGIVNHANIQQLADFKEAVIASDQLTQSYLPAAPKKSKIARLPKIGLGIYFDRDKTDVFIRSFIGSTSSEGEISTHLQYLNHQLFVEKQEEFEATHTELVKFAYQLSYEQSNVEEKAYFPAKIQTLHELIERANALEIPFYFIKEPYLERLQKRNLEPISLKSNTGELTFEVTENDVFFETNAYLKIDKKKKLTSYKCKEYYLFAKENDTYYLHPNKNMCDVIQFFAQVPNFKVLQKDFDEFKRNILEPVAEKYPVTYKYLPKISIEKEPKTTFKKQLYLSQMEGFILLKPAVAVDQEIVPLYSAKKIKVEKEGATYEILRNQTLEQQFDEEIKGLHPKFKHQNNEFLFLHEDELMENEWFLNFFNQVKELDIEIFGRNDLKLKYNQNKASISVNINSGIDWFDVDVAVAFGNQKVSLRDLKKNIINRDKYVQLKDGTIGILPEDWMQKYFSVFKSGTVSKEGIKVSKYQFSVVDTLYENYENETNLFDEHLKIREKLQNFSSVKSVRSPRGINAQLRPYQKEGLKWLNFLDDFNLGGCLADDMGLGKTLQIISFIKHIKTKRKPKQAHLVIVPTSLIFNWNEEVQKFCPELNVYTHTGTKRSKDIEAFKGMDMVLTTYGLVMNDSKLLSTYEFHYIILDESQAIKNPNSKRYKSIKILKAKNRLVMTGTPIENNTFDLYAQMNFINPGLLGGIQQFKTDYANAIDKNKDVKVAEELRQIIHPFLMRRTKEQVMTDLPPKTEQVLYCEMGKEQRKVYEALKNKFRDYLMNKIDEQGFEKSQMFILEALTKLRQVCNSPSLLNDEQDYTNESVKIDLLLENIVEKTGKHKILVFSQFTSMLGLIKNRLDQQKINYEYLDGRIKNRQSKVENFQTNEEIRIFLISLKAGGTGLNLTAADYVYIVDPWWNPAAEAQAIDRCYRIGQNKNVMAYKMICKDSIEEKIVQLQEGKKQVSNDLIQTEKSFVKQLTKNSLQDLFK